MIRIKRAADGHQRVTFALAQDDLPGIAKASVVGNFNEWEPGRHELRKRSNGTLSTTVEVAEGTTLTFRYLGDDGVWFNDSQAEVDHLGNCRLTV
ncbi:isoamylase [Actinokineospora sp.]|uniref:isoamylase n=1 Tax=Actinokineospora sp. TaxID=1872133 RepID=UPI003D6B4B18